MNFDYPEINIEYAPEPLEDSIVFFLKNEILGGCYWHDENIISIYSMCPKVSSDLPYIKDVVYTIDHESMHWIIFGLAGYWSSWCFDNIARSIEKWIMV